MAKPQVAAIQPDRGDIRAAFQFSRLCPDLQPLSIQSPTNVQSVPSHDNTAKQAAVVDVVAVLDRAIPAAAIASALARRQQLHLPRDDLGLQLREHHLGVGQAQPQRFDARLRIDLQRQQRQRV